MKPERKTLDALEMREVADVEYGAPSAASMVRTQIYLTRAEHDYLQREAARRGEPMAAVIRGIIDDRMTVPEDAWTNNPLLEPTPIDPEFEGAEDSSLNHDHYAYGAPKQYKKIRGKWVLKSEDEP